VESPFNRIFSFTIKWEGGSKYTNDPDDPGGGTKYGISQKNNPYVDVKTLTEEEAKEIYKTKYWNPVTKGEDDNLDMACFDTAVNCGVGRVKNWLQDAKEWQDILAMRRLHYEAIITKNPVLAKYANGWENRVKALENFLEG
jgi:lysozyme family protein